MTVAWEIWRDAVVGAVCLKARVRDHASVREWLRRVEGDVRRAYEAGATIVVAADHLVLRVNRIVDAVIAVDAELAEMARRCGLTLAEAEEEAMMGWNKAQAKEMAKHIGDRFGKRRGSGSAWSYMPRSAQNAYVAEFVLDIVLGQELEEVRVEDVRVLLLTVRTELGLEEV